jgi:arylsulfatase B
MMKKLDDSVGDVIEALNEKQILNNTIILFISDNGAMTSGNSLNYGSNWPLRGLKMSPFEGGVRVTAALWSPGRVKSHLYEDYVHVTDWLPTLLKAVGVDPPDSIDGYDIWEEIQSNKKSKRSVFFEIDDTDGYKSVTSGDYKLISGTTNKAYSDYQGGNLLGVIGKPPSYMDAIKESKAYKVFTQFGNVVLTDDIVQIRNKMKIECNKHFVGDVTVCYPGIGT